MQGNRNIIVLLLVWAWVLSVKAQPLSDTLQHGRLVLKAFVSKSEVRLRWLSSDGFLNQYSHRHFLLERFTLSSNGKRLKVMPRVRFAGMPMNVVSPDSLDLWKDPTGEAQAMAALIREANTASDDDSALSTESVNADLIRRNNAEMLAMMLSLKRFDLAMATGQAFAEHHAEPGNIYLYKVVVYNGKGFDSAFLTVDPQQYSTLPEPAGISAVTDAENIRLSWLPDRNYYAWQLEYTTGDIGFVPVTSAPLVFDDKAMAVPRLSYGFQLPSVQGPVRLRLRGLDIFGQTGAWSDTLTVNIQQPLIAFPTALTQFDSAGRSWIKFDFPASLESCISRFDIETADSAEGQFVIGEKLPPACRVFPLQDVRSSGYLKVVARDLLGRRSESFPALFQYRDSLPPAPPVWWQASTGKGGVSLMWKRNSETDFRSYSILRGNSRNAEFSFISDTMVTDTFYTDSFPDRWMQDTVYYALLAEDQRYNRSAPSEILVVPLPDRVPPPAPAWSRITPTDSGVWIAWTHETRDTRRIRVFREENGMRVSLAVCDSGVYLDRNAPCGADLYYLLRAEDASGNLSEWTSPVLCNYMCSQWLPAVETELWKLDSSQRRIQCWWKYSNREDLSHFSVLVKDQAGRWHQAGVADREFRFAAIPWNAALKITDCRVIAYATDGRKSKMN